MQVKFTRTYLAFRFDYPFESALEGQPLQIKLTLTAAKVAVEGGSDVALPGEAATADVKSNVTNETIPQEPSEEEKERLAMLLNKLGL